MERNLDNLPARFLAGTITKLAPGSAPASRQSGAVCFSLDLALISPRFFWINRSYSNLLLP